MKATIPFNLREAAAFTAGIADRELPADVLDAAKKCLADWLGVAIGARDEPAARAVRSVIATWRAPGAAQVLFGAATTPSAAALANGTLAHCLDFDDTHVGSVAHLSGPSWAAVLAAGGARSLRERELLGAFVAAYEVGAQLGGQGFGVAVDHAGWHSTGVFGCLAATAGAAAAMRLSQDATAAALGTGATQVGGLTGSFGTMAKPFHAGKAAFNGVLAAELASAGLVPALGLIEPDGPLAHALVQRGEHALPRVDFDRGWEILRNTFKPYACCLLTHATIDAGRALATKLRGRAIAKVTAFVNPLAIDLAGKPAPVTPLEGKFSTAYCAALALSGRAATQDDFSMAQLDHPEMRALTAKVTLVPDAKLAETAARMIVELDEGSPLTATVPMARGNPDNPMSWDDLQVKFTSLVAPKLGAASAIELFTCVRAFEEVGALSSLWRICAAGSEEAR